MIVFVCSVLSVHRQSKIAEVRAQLFCQVLLHVNLLFINYLQELETK